MIVNLAGSRDLQLEELLQASGLRVVPVRLDDLTALAHPSAQQPALVIMDMRDKGALPPAVGMLRRHHPATGVVIVASALEPALMLEAMRAGVTEFLTMPLGLSELQAAISRVTTPVSAAANGEVIAFMGAKGGVGTTTVAVNVATALAQLAVARPFSSIFTSRTETRLYSSEASRGSLCWMPSRTSRGSTRRSSTAWLATLVGASRSWPRPIVPRPRRWTRHAFARWWKQPRSTTST
jgi:DNA-binding NarL/FixJ family response regulator